MPPGDAAQTLDGQTRPGARLGRYRLMDVLGQGAMATVFRAHDPQLRRQVAIKVMNLALAARSDAAERFRREAQAVAAVKHDGIVELHDFVPALDGEPAYIVSELIEGPTLRRQLDARGGRLLPELAARLVHPVALALAAAHARGVVHRDIKPDNIMIDVGSRRSRVVLADFGVAHVVGMEKMTATGALIGSPAYMSPEQARGLDVGPGTDIWALGVLLYELSTGHVPFAGRDPFAVVSAIARGQFRRASQLEAKVSPALDRLISCCLERDPSRRFASAADLADALSRIVTSAGLEELDLQVWCGAYEPIEESLRSRVATAAVESARQHVRRNEIGKALTELGRAEAYRPGHPEARRLLDGLSARKRWMKVGGVALGLAATAGIGGMALRPDRSPPVRDGRPDAPGLAATPAQKPQQPLEDGPASPAPEPAPDKLAVARPTTARLPRKGGNPRRGASALPVAYPGTTHPDLAKEGATVASPTADGPPPSPAAISNANLEGVAAPATPTTPAASGAGGQAAAALTVRVRLTAEYGFCYPTLDDHPPGDLAPTYVGVSPGVHRVGCSPTRGGPIRPVGDVRIPDDHRGPHPLRVVVKKPPLGEQPRVVLVR